ncbi:MAG: helix-turn-helix domain-containing protein [Acidobacteria bacterium]|nr:helix-turn-helix domain-containing protein [Acidobacteriota bacterium]
MSYKATAWAYDLPLKGPAKPVLTALADFADEAGSCYPGQEQLALMTGLSLSTVARAIRRLEQMELLTREHRYDARGYRTSDRFHLAVGAQVLPVTAPTRQSAYQSDSLPGAVTPPTGQSDGTKRTSSLEPPVDPSGGAPAAPAAAAAPTPESISPTCRRHPDGTDRPCTACRKARIAWEHHLAGIEPGLLPPPTPARRPVKHMPGLCDDHRQPEGACEMCDRENAQAAATLRNRFGGAA